MQSFSDLNNYSQSSREYEDFRDPNVLFDRDTPTPPATISINEGISHTVPIAIEITDIINYTQSALVITFDLRNLTGATASFGTLASHITVNNATSGLYIISGLKSVGDWNSIKSPTIGLPNAYYGIWQYTVNFDYFSATANANKNFIVTVDVANVNVFSTPLNDIFETSVTKTIQNTPQIIDAGISSPTYTVTVTPSAVANISTLTGYYQTPGATSSFNNTTKVLTITGNLAGTNSTLANIELVPTSLEADFTFTYTVSNNLNAETDTVIQQMKCLQIQYLSAVGATANYYNEDTAKTLLGLPTITDTSYDGSGTYTYTITPLSTSSVLTFSSTGTGGTSSFNSGTKVLSITGTRTQVNSHLSNVVYTPAADYVSNTTFYYKVITPRGGSATATKTQQILIGSQDTEITNMNITRTYLANQGNSIFSSNTPFISDADSNSPIYTIFLTCGFGQFTVGSTTPANTYSYTGTKAEVNAIFPTITFYPNKGVYATGTFAYTQQKNGTTQVSQTVSLVGTNATWPGNNTSYTYNSSGTWTPTPDQVKYGGFADVICVGGGGGGAYGGGAGGSVVERHNISITYQNYSITVGGGGAAARTDYPTTSFNFYGATGQTSSALGVGAAGGAGGRRGVTYGSPTTYSINGGGGTSYDTDYPTASTTSYTGGTGQATATYQRAVGASYVTTNVRTGGGGSGSGGNGTSGGASGTTFTKGLGGAASNGYGGGGGGGTLRYSGSTVVENSTGAQGTGPGGGGGGAQGFYSPTQAVPTAGTAGRVVITVHS